MDTSTGTQIATTSVTNTKLAIALLFLGAASLAAAGAGGRFPRGYSQPPDLMIRAAAFNQYEFGKEMITEDRDVLSVYYRNIGKGAVDKPFKISVSFSVPPYDDELYIAQITAVGAAGSGYSGGFDSPTLMPAEKISDTLFSVSAHSADTVTPLVSKLNAYALNPGETGVVYIVIPKYYKAMLQQGQNVNISLKVDYVDGKPGGVVGELDETNNEYALSLSYNQLTDKGEPCDPTNAEYQEYNNACAAADTPIICLDAYTHTFKGCGMTASDCSKYLGQKVACAVDDQEKKQPVIKEVKVQIGDKLFKSDVSMVDDGVTHLDPNNIEWYSISNKGIENQDIKVRVDVVNADETVQYAATLFPQPLSMTVEYAKSSFGSYIVPKMVWNSEATFTPEMLDNIYASKPNKTSFWEASKSFGYFGVHVGVKNGDDMYPLNKLELDDAALLTFVFESATSSAALIGNTVAGCGAEIKQPGEYTLAKDLECDINGIIIYADDVHLDCKNHSITGTGVAFQAGMGIRIKGDNVSVKNCTVTGFKPTGVWVDGVSANVTLSNNYICNNTGYDVYCPYDSSITATGNTADPFKYCTLNVSPGGEENISCSD